MTNVLVTGRVGTDQGMGEAGHHLALRECVGAGPHET